MDILGSSIVHFKNSKVRAQGGLYYGDAVFIPNNQKNFKPNHLVSVRKDGVLACVNGEMFGNTFFVNENIPQLDCVEVRIDKKKNYYECIVKGYILGGMILKVEPKKCYFDPNLREIKDLNFYEQMVKDLKYYEETKSDDPRDKNYLYLFLEKFLDRKNPYEDGVSLKKLIEENKTLGEAYNNRQNPYLTKEQAEELHSYMLAVCKSTLTDEFGKLGEAYYGYDLMLKKLVRDRDLPHNI